MVTSKTDNLTCSSRRGSQCSSQERLLAAQAAAQEPPRVPCPHCALHQHSLKLIGSVSDIENQRRSCKRSYGGETGVVGNLVWSQRLDGPSGSQGSGMNHWASLSDSGGSGNAAQRAPSPQSPARRVRSRSLSSPSRSPASGGSAEGARDDAVSAMSALFAARFPAAQRTMNQKLNALVEELSELDKKPDRPPIERFVQRQVLQSAKNCLQKSEAKQITSRYLYDMAETLDRLLAETREKSPEAGASVAPLVTRFTLAMARPAKLLECLEFDPERFYRLLEEAEGQARHLQGITTDIPQYIIHKLGLSRDPLADFNTPPAPPPPPPQNQSPSKSRGRQSPPGGANGAPPSENDYQVIKLISNGAYGAVYLVKHKQTRQRYAMKKISKNNLILRNQVEQAFAERDILSFADNPFVVTMYCSFETKRHLCLILEFVEGGDCATLLKAGPLPPDMARHYFAEAVLAVEYLHSYGIVHRDLKPDNLFLFVFHDNLLITATGHIKLTDFGLSKMGLMSLATNLYEEYADREARQFSDKQVCGTPEYIAPEVILRQGYGKPVDWWSMGIILYEFLVGCVPFFGDTPEELFAHTVNDDIEWPSEDDFPIAVEARAIITQLLARNPRDRLGTGGTHEVKDHIYFCGLDWNNLLRRKAEFIPQLENDEDTSYFDSRCDRYNHSEADTDEAAEGGEEAGVFAAFSSTSPQWRRHYHHSALSHDSRSTDSWPGTPDSAGPPTTPTAPFHHHPKCPIASGATSTAESSQTDSDDVSPGARRRAVVTRHAHAPVGPGHHLVVVQPSPLAELPKKEDRHLDKSDKSEKSKTTVVASKAIRRSASTSGLSLVIHPAEESMVSGGAASPCAGNTSSTNSSRDSSPCRDPPSPFALTNQSLIQSSKPPIVVRRGPRGFGFTIHTVRVYYGDTTTTPCTTSSLYRLIRYNAYCAPTRQQAVSEHGAAWAAGLRAGDLITQLNGESVLRLLLAAPHATLRATPLDQTTIQAGGRKRAGGGRRASAPPRPRPRRRCSLFRRISNKRASQEMHQMVTAVGSGECPASPASPCADGPLHAPTTPHYQRPSTLHGLKHKLSGAGTSAGVVAVEPVRRQSLQHMPLSPLARTPSPGPPPSPTRNNDGHLLNEENNVKEHKKNYFESVFVCEDTDADDNVTAMAALGVGDVGDRRRPRSCGGLAKSLTMLNFKAVVIRIYLFSYARCEASGAGGAAGAGAARDCGVGGRRAWARRDPASPLLRRALSPDRLHPRSAENKCSISPLCCGAGGAPPPSVSAGGVGGVGVGGGVRRGVWRAGPTQAQAPPTPPPLAPQDDPPLPRIAEEKDSPTHAAKTPAQHRTPAKHPTPNMFTSSPKPSSSERARLDSSLASLSPWDESFVCADTSSEPGDVSALDTTDDVSTDRSRFDSRSSAKTNTSTSQEDHTRTVSQDSTPSVTDALQQKVRKKSDSSLKEEDVSKSKDRTQKQKEKPELKKQESNVSKKSESIDFINKLIHSSEAVKRESETEIKPIKPEPITRNLERSESIKKPEPMARNLERSESIKKSEQIQKTNRTEFKKQDQMQKQEKSDKKSDKVEHAKKQDKNEKKNEFGSKKGDLKKQESIDTVKVVDTSEVSSNDSKNKTNCNSSSGSGGMVSRLLGVMSRKGTKEKEEDDGRPPKKADKQHKKKGNHSANQQQQTSKSSECTSTERADVEDKKCKKGRGRMSSSSSGEK
ncbi:hypothetical protein EVAR_74223_1 [Eumeta japonica]|uniref:non-specific serine/threonine protein kinase n=1 Tax=Eumeta variegata TaxID=151549 RepID=A0A4C1SCB8_EUMVA|nr:hypothetical protein EVAR_74223_1 [Eumeta japonica]